MPNAHFMQIMPGSTPITPESIDWRQDAPFSQRYGDRYHTSSGAHAQACHVFLDGCGLPARWCEATDAPPPSTVGDTGGSAADSPLQTPERPRPAATLERAPDTASVTPETWVMLETGFGLGLNFLSTWALWRATTDRRAARLRFVSTEAHPVSADTLARATRQADPVLQALGQRLAGRWPIRDGRADMQSEASPALSSQDIHLSFDDGEVELIVLIGDARERLKQELQEHGPLGAHSVFLDGFDPRKNPAIWHEDTLKAVAAHCQPDARLATWSVSRPVRDALTAAGFIPQKRPGLPPKRHCLSATLKTVG